MVANSAAACILKLGYYTLMQNKLMGALSHIIPSGLPNMLQNQSIGFISDLSLMEKLD